MSEKLSVEAIRNAAELVNTSLLSKGYIESELKFPIIDWPYLIQDQPHKDDLAHIEVKETLYNNDKNVINIIYSLTQSIDRHQVQHKSFNKAITQKNLTIDELRAKVHLLENQVRDYEDRLDRTVHVDQISLTEQVRSLTLKNKLHSLEIQRLKNFNTDLQTKYQVEMRKKAIEISQLKDKLLDSRNLSNTTSYGRPFDLTPKSGDLTSFPEVNTNIIYNNKPIIDNSFVEESGIVNAIREQENESIATQLSQLIESLIKENSKFANFVNELNRYFDKFNEQMSVLNYRKLSVTSLINPSTEIDLEKVLNEVSTDLEPFELISRPLLSNVYKNYNYVSGLVDVAVSNLEVGFAGQSDQDTQKIIDSLKEENQALQEKWQDAIKSLENWKRYRLK